MSFMPEASKGAALPRLADTRLGDRTGDPHRVTRFKLPLCKDPKTQAQETELLFGETVYVQDRLGDFALCVNQLDHYRGFVPVGALAADSNTPTHRITHRLSHAYSEPDLKSVVLQQLPYGGRLIEQTGSTDKFLSTTAGFVPRGHVALVAETRPDPVQEALAWTGTPYLWGGRTATGIDCSALVQLAFGACGIPLHRDSDLQWRTAGTLISERPESGAQRGDLAFFPGHVGLMVSETEILHANATHMSVTVDLLADVIDWVAADLSPESDTPPFLGFKRISF